MITCVSSAIYEIISSFVQNTAEFDYDMSSLININICYD